MQICVRTVQNTVIRMMRILDKTLSKYAEQLCARVNEPLDSRFAKEIHILQIKVDNVYRFVIKQTHKQFEEIEGSHN